MAIFPKITTIIATCNRPAFIKLAVDSIIDQNYYNTEIIVVDDGSSPPVSQVLGDYINKGIIHYIFQDNKGRSAARNVGLNRTTGDYVTFLDDDDELLNNYYQELVTVMESNKALKLAFCNCYKEKTGSFQQYINDEFKDDNIFVRQIYSHMIPIMCIMFRKEAVINCYFNEELDFCEDYDFIMKIMRKDNVSFINQPLAVYHLHADNSVNNGSFEINLANLQVMTELFKRHQNDRYLRNHILTAYRRYFKKALQHYIKKRNRQYLIKLFRFDTVQGLTATPLYWVLHQLRLIILRTHVYRLSLSQAASELITQKKHENLSLWGILV
ncbi:MAG TPA: hypothetical protein DF296_14260 [Candidatus Margulisbacteria bacterium]|nr:hypothetical protein [Candidatus Margulisiibacteriota bacterium]